MHFSSLVLLPLFTSQAIAGCVYARGASGAAPHDFLNNAEGAAKRDNTRVLIGDLANGVTSSVGQSIANILLQTESAQSSVVGRAPTSNAACAKDTCCLWYKISADLSALWPNCNDLARAAIRLGFHDAADWQTGMGFGGADGSLVLFKEYNRPENNGLQQISAALLTVHGKYHGLGISMADLIQYSATHATVTCPLGPRVRSFVGRVDGTQKAPSGGLLPDVNGSPDSLVELFNNKTIVSTDLIALLGAHSISKQFFVNPNLAGEGQDTTPNVWDVSFYSQTQQNRPANGVFRFASDVALSRYSQTSGDWQSFAQSTSLWNERYAQAYVRLSLLGVNVINQMTECTQTLPRSVGAPRSNTFSNPFSFFGSFF